MNPQAYEQLVLRAAKRRRYGASADLEDGLCADPEAAEMADCLDFAVRKFERLVEATAPSAEDVASQRASLLAEIKRRNRARRVRWAGAGGLAVAASLVFAIAISWQAPVVGRAKVSSISDDVSEERVLDVRRGVPITAGASTNIRIELGAIGNIELTPHSSVMVDDQRIVLLSGNLRGKSGTATMRIEFAVWSLEVGRDTIFGIKTSGEGYTLWTDRQAKVLDASGERVIAAGKTTRLVSGGIGER